MYIRTTLHPLPTVRTTYHDGTYYVQYYSSDKFSVSEYI